jgi:membrane protein YqaA with SNARE-associated domain
VIVEVLRALLRAVSPFGGYLGVFTISLVSNSVPFLGVPYLLFVAGYIAREAVRLGLPVELTLITLSALGATLGKLVVYFLAASFRLKLSSRTKENLKVFANFSKRLALPLVVFFAATPAPDDLLYVPLGLSRYSLVYYFTGVFLGKFIMVWLSSTYFKVIVHVLGKDFMADPVASIAVALVTAYLCLIILKIDWSKVTFNYSEKGLLKALRTIFTEYVEVNRLFLRRMCSRLKRVSTAGVQVS